MLLPMFTAGTDQVRGREGWGDVSSRTAGTGALEWREIALAGPVVHDEVRMAGRCGDLGLAGKSRLIDP